MYCINYFNKSCLAVNFSELSVSKIMVAKPDLTGGGRGGGKRNYNNFQSFFSIQKQNFKKKIARQNDKRTKKKFNLELLVRDSKPGNILAKINTTLNFWPPPWQI